LTDTKYFLGLSDFYGCDILIISVVFRQPREGVDHLCLADAERLISEIKPEKTILTHFGMTMLAASPKQEAERLSRRLNRQILAAYDGMTLNFS
jgi:phosphoribosyl 1,2-cyclic phosphodiesterase